MIKPFFLDVIITPTDILFSPTGLMIAGVLVLTVIAVTIAVWLAMFRKK